MTIIEMNEARANQRKVGPGDDAARRICHPARLGNCRSRRISRMTITAPARHSWVEVLRGYVALTKPRIIELLLVTTIPTMVVAANGFPGLWLVVATLPAARWPPAAPTRSTW
jgi:hypothetical protein